MRLTYFPANDAWAFHLGDAMVRLHDPSGAHPMFFSVRDDAVDAARQCGLTVSKRGKVEVAR